MDNLAFTLAPIIIGSMENVLLEQDTGGNPTFSTDHQLMPQHKKGGQPDAPLACAGQTETITGHGDVLSVDNSHVVWMNSIRHVKLDELFVFFAYTG